MKKDLNFNQICGKIIKDARTKKGISIEELAIYLLPIKEEKNYLENHELKEVKIDGNLEKSFLRRQIFEDVEMEKLYQENIKKINYWENGNGFPNLEEIYKLAEYIDVNPNELFKYRELGRKSLKGEQEISKWKYYRNRVIDENLESLKILFPALVFSVLLYLVLTPQGGNLIENILTFFRLNFAGMR